MKKISGLVPNAEQPDCISRASSLSRLELAGCCYLLVITRVVVMLAGVRLPGATRTHEGEGGASQVPADRVRRAVLPSEADHTQGSQGIFIYRNV